MPYKIRKLPGRAKYRVTNPLTGRVFAKATTLEKARAQVRMLVVMNNNK
jgi:hypothetical protein